MRRDICILIIVTSMLIAGFEISAEVRNLQGKVITDTQQYLQTLGIMLGTGQSLQLNGKTDTAIQMYLKVRENAIAKNDGYYMTATSWMGDCYINREDTKALVCYKEIIEIDSGSEIARKHAYPMAFYVLCNKTKGYEEANKLANTYNDLDRQIISEIYLKKFEVVEPKIKKKIYEENDTGLIPSILEVYKTSGGETALEKILNEYVDNLEKKNAKHELLENLVKEGKEKEMFYQIVNAYYSLAMQYRTKEEYNRSSQACERILGMTGKDGEFVNVIKELRGDNLFGMKEAEKGIRAYKEILETPGIKEETVNRINWKLAERYVKEKKYEDALAIYKTMKKTNEVVNCLTLLGRHDEALQYLEDVMNSLEK